MRIPPSLLLIIIFIAAQMYLSYEVGGAPPPIILPEINSGFISNLLNNVITTVNQIIGITPLVNLPIGEFISGRSTPDILQINGGGVMNLAPNILPRLYQTLFDLIRSLIKQIVAPPKII